MTLQCSAVRVAAITTVSGNVPVAQATRNALYVTELSTQWFRSVDGASNTIAGDEAMNIIRKGQIRWLPKTEVVGQGRFVERTLGIAA